MPEPMTTEEIAAYKHKELIEGLRALARFLEEHPELGTPSKPSLYYFLDADKDRIPEFAHAFGRCEKLAAGDYFDLTKHFGPVTLQASWDREQVCERVVVGVEEIEEEVPVAYEKRKIKREKIRWHCPSSILNK